MYTQVLFRKSEGHRGEKGEREFTENKFSTSLKRIKCTLFSRVARRGRRLAHRGRGESMVLVGTKWQACPVICQNFGRPRPNIPINLFFL